uniref:Uncharacterized protein n=1 Tax=Rhizophora mucronata TaxID=61149 RepID=A0A2P2Q9Y4_RHIMU
MCLKQIFLSCFDSTGIQYCSCFRSMELNR